MIKEKYNKFISLITIIIAVIFVVSSLFFIDPESTSASSTSIVENVLDKESITEINIEISDEDWQWLLENATDEEYRGANITINGETFYNVGVRPKGNSSLTTVASNSETDRFSLKIDFDQYIKGQTYHGIEKLALNNMMSDTTYMKEYLSYDMYEFLGVPVPEYSYTNIKINGEDWGLYLAVEVIEERFIEKNYGELAGNLYKPETMDMGGGKGDKMPNMGDKDGMPQMPNMGGNNGGFPMPDMNNGNGGFQMPDMNNGGFQKPDMSGNNNQMPQMPNMDGNNGGFPMPDMNNGNGGFQMPDMNNGGFQKPDMSGNNNQMPQMPNMDGNNGGFKMPDMSGNNGGFQMPFGNSSGANLKYIDDEISSYSVIRDSAVFKTTTDTDFKKVINMIKNLNDGTNLDEVLNVEEVLKYFAVNTFLVNLDSYSGGMYHNYYLYEKDGKCEIIPWDLNMSFAGFSANSASSAVNFPIDSPVTGNLENAPLIGKFLEVDEYKELYHSYLEKIVNEYINNDVFNNKVIMIDKLINNYVKGDKTAFFTYEEYKNSIPEIITFALDRAKSVVAQLNGDQPSTEYGNIETTLNLSALGQMQMGGGKGNENRNPSMGGNMPNMSDIPSQEVMMKVMEILKDSNINELTKEQKSQLEELGVDKNVVTMVQSIMTQGDGKQHGGMMQQGGMQQGGMPQNMEGIGSIKQSGRIDNALLIQLGVITLVSILGILFVFKYNRKKYS